MASYNNTTSSILSTIIPFPLPMHLRSPSHVYFMNDEQKAYTPSLCGVLTYCIPRIHKSVTEDFLKKVLTDFFNIHIGICFDLNNVERVDFIPIEGNANFKKAFVYHRAMTYEDKDNHLNRLAFAKNHNYWNNYRFITTMDIVNRITTDLFQSEKRHEPIKVYFTDKGQCNYWMLLPNLNPLTTYQVHITEQLSDLSTELISGLANLTSTGLSIPNDFDVSVLDDERVDTAWELMETQNEQFQEKMVKLTRECDRIRNYTVSCGKFTVDDLYEMDRLELDMDEEDAAIEAMHKERAEMNNAYGYSS